LLRLKEDYDGAEPAASSVSVMNLLILSHLGIEETRSESYATKIDLTLQSFSGRTAKAGRTVPMMLASLSSYHAGTPQVVIVGDRQAADTDALLHVVKQRYRPTMVTLCIEPPARDAIAERLPWVASLRQGEGRATAFLCREFACKAPTNEPVELARQLDEV